MLPAFELCRRPGILVLINEVDWELRYNVLLDSALKALTDLLA